MPWININQDKYTSLRDFPAISKILGEDIKLLVGALRLILLPLLTNRAEADCGELRKFCCGDGKLAANYWVGDRVAVVEAQLGSLRRGQIPCAVDRRRMPPLARYEDYDLVRVAESRVYVDVGKLLVYPLFRAAKRVVDSLGFCGARDVASFATCAGLPEAAAVDAIALLRLLFPNLLEVHNAVSFNELLARWGVGRAVPADLLWEEARKFVRRGFVLPSLRSLPRTVRVVRSQAARYSIPALLAHADFKDAVVADVGSGFGTKGAASLRWGAKYVVLLDIDVEVLKSRGNGLLIDKVVADAHMLPLRSRSIDVAVFWNVLNFLARPHEAVEEIRRVTRRETVFSTYNAGSGRYIAFREFISIASRWGVPKVVKRLGNTQFQAVVKIHED
jgi:DTW domain-containing protein YfiP